MRRILTIGAIVIVLLGVGSYFYFSTDSANIVVAPPGSTGLPTAGPGAALPGETEGASGVLPGAPTPVSARLVKISAGPVVPGEVIVNKAGSASSSPEVAISYIERTSGNVFTYLARAKTLTRTSNRTIPGIQSASWLPNASSAFVRYLSGEDFSTINTYALPANGVGGFFLPQNLASVAVSSTGVLMTASGVNGSTASLARTDGTRASQIFTTPLSAIHTSFAGKSQYLVYTKPSSSLPGTAFLVDSAGRFSRIAGPLYGLAALASPSGKWVLVSYTLDGAMQMKLVNTTSGADIALPVATIADKCAWTENDSSLYCGIPMDPSSNARYPDDWYQGAEHFSDRVWRIDVASRYAQLVLDFNTETDAALDAEALAVDPLATVLVFVNKNDGSLWSYSL
ncbi:MAG: hypothetical protein WC814_00035 [Candidatus Paceibacterota bacterium]